MSVANLKTLYNTRETIRKQTMEERRNADATGQTSTSGIDGQLHSVDSMINQIVTFMRDTLKDTYIETNDMWQEVTPMVATATPPMHPSNDENESQDEARPSFLSRPAMPATTFTHSVRSSASKASPSPSPSPVFASSTTTRRSPMTTLLPLEGLLELDKTVANERWMEQEDAIQRQTNLVAQKRMELRDSANQPAVSAARPSGISHSKSLGALSLCRNPSDSADALEFPAPGASAPASSSTQFRHLAQIRCYFQRLFFSDAHPYGSCVLAFIRRMSDVQGKRWPHHTGRSSTDPVPQTFLPSYLASIRTFLSTHFRLVLATYPFLTHAGAIRKQASIILSEGVFEQLAPTIRIYYQKLYRAETSWIERHFEKFISARTIAASPGSHDSVLRIPMQAFGIDPRVWSEWERSGSTPSSAVSFPFPRTLSMLEQLFSVATLRSKLEFLLAVCQEVSEEYASYMRGKEATGGNASMSPSTPIKQPKPGASGVSSLLGSGSPFAIARAFHHRMPGSTQSPPPTVSTAAHPTSPVVSCGSIFLSTDDLIPLLAYISMHLPRHCWPFLFSDLKMVEAHLDESASMGEKGFALAAHMSAMQVCVEGVAEG